MTVVVVIGVEVDQLTPSSFERADQIVAGLTFSAPSTVRSP